jgi:hypothetical protein
MQVHHRNAIGPEPIVQTHQPLCDRSEEHDFGVRVGPPRQDALLHLRFGGRRASVEKLEDVGMIARQQRDSLLVVIQKETAPQRCQ